MKVYKSKISYVLLLFVSLILVSVFILGIIKAESNQSIIIAITAFVLPFGFVLHLFLNTEYAIVNDVLKIKSGFLYNKDLDVYAIKSICESKSLVSAPAASLDRIELKYGKYASVIISPKDKLNFITDLVKINPNIVSEIKE